jgi:hypothetical protein
MVNEQINTPVVFIIFKRPDTTEKVFEAIRRVKPPKLLVVADGPRAEQPSEVEKCSATRAIIDRVDWDCEVLKNYSETNLGCMQRVSSGLDWVFKTVPEAIILEDDCLPDATFFRFCEELLERYRDDERVMTVCGVNFQFGRRINEYSYYYSIYHDCWGWATWRRAWKYYDIEMKLWPKLRDTSFLKDKLLDARSGKYWGDNFQAAYDKNVDTWFYRWLFSCWIQNGMGIFPQENLVSNIGVGIEATNTKIAERWEYANMSRQAINFPLNHPPFMFPDLKADKFVQKTRFESSLFRKVQKKVNKLSKKYFKG